MALAVGPTSASFTRPSWKEQDLGSWVQTWRYLHQWQRYGLSTQDRHLGTEEEKAHITGPVCTQSRKPKAPAKHALIVGEATLKHSGRADLVKNLAPFSPSPQEVESLWPPPF